jgi:hypothetical protein
MLRPACAFAGDQKRGQTEPQGARQGDFGSPLIIRHAVRAIALEFQNSRDRQCAVQLGPLPRSAHSGARVLTRAPIIPHAPRTGHLASLAHQGHSKIKERLTPRVAGVRSAHGLALRNDRVPSGHKL